MRTDIAVIGAGAAGLMAAIWAGRTLGARAEGDSPRIVALDGAKSLGAKILVAGGGRCNVTHHAVSEDDYAGSTRAAIRKVLRRFDVPTTVRFFQELGVELKREETGKLFPVTDRARTVLEALLTQCRGGAELRNPWRVSEAVRAPHGFIVRGTEGELHAQRIILCTGGMALPRSGSDGAAYSIAAALGHTFTPRVFPALVPLVLPGGHFLRELSGVTVPATLELRAPSGKRLEAFTDSTLFTHTGLSGPSVLNISRYVLARAGGGVNAVIPPGARTESDTAERGFTLHLNVLPGETFETVDARLQGLGRNAVLGLLKQRIPERLARALCAHASVDPATPGHALEREARRALARALAELPLDVVEDRGFGQAEATAGGVPLDEVNLATMESRVCPGLHLAGEICDVDGRIGGFNFQWAWASGFVAGCAAAEALRS